MHASEDESANVIHMQNLFENLKNYKSYSEHQNYILIVPLSF
jgi:hypothetical protein